MRVNPVKPIANLRPLLDAVARQDRSIAIQQETLNRILTLQGAVVEEMNRDEVFIMDLCKRIQELEEGLRIVSQRMDVWKPGTRIIGLNHYIQKLLNGEREHFVDLEA